jgi:small-conductance mechanosensitive channel
MRQSLKKFLGAKRVMNGLVNKIILVLIAVALSLTAGTVAAQTDTSGSITITLPVDMDPAARDSLVRALSELGQPISVAESQAANGMPANTTGTAIASIMDRLDGVMLAASDLPAIFADWWSSLSGGGSSSESLLILGVIAVAVVAAAACEWGLDRLLDPWRQKSLNAKPIRFSERFGAAFGWMALDVLGIAAFAAAAFLVGWLLLPATPEARLTLGIVIAAIVKVRLVLTVARLIFAPRRPNLRLVDMTDEEASLVWGWILVTAAATVFAYGVRDLLLASGTSADGVALLGLFAAVVALVVRLVAILRIRTQIRELILRTYTSASGEPYPAARLFSGLWHVVFILLVFLDFAGSAYTELTETHAHVASLFFGAFFVAAIAPFVIGGCGALIDDLFFQRDDRPTRRDALGEALKVFLQGSIVLLVFAYLMTAWGIDPFVTVDAGPAQRAAHAILQVGGAVLLGWTLWRAVKLVLDYYATLEEGGDEHHNEDGDGMGSPGSRLATALPVIRGFILAAIITISAMIALSALGVDIGPLIAGAGVLGLAIGFGAQTLVKDIITGLFYLAEDAFRKGEYIQTSAGKGVVEMISLRSVRLRHHNGPLHTIPFGSMGNITNHSRDWVRIKFQIRVPFTTDLELLRKTIKRVGQELQQDPDLGPLFLEPVKSQGATSTDDSGFVTSVKFVCRPGQQFVIRRQAYARIQKAFEAAGIEFASRRVTVDSDEDEDSEQSDSKTAAASIAVSPAQTQ